MNLQRMTVGAVNRLLRRTRLRLISDDTLRAIRTTQDRIDQQLNTLMTRLQTASMQLEPSRGSQASALTLTLPELNERWLTIVGAARSGTTILASCFNQSPDIHLLEESNLYANARHDNFPAYFNNMRRNIGKFKRRGTHLPEAPFSLTGPFEYFGWLGTQHRIIGEKLAFGPHGLYGDRTHQEAFFDFNWKYFYSGTYILLLRHPVPTIKSMSKMFPDRPVRALIETWLQTAALLVDCYLCLPHCYWLFFDRMDVSDVYRLAEILNVDVTLPDGMFDKRHCRTDSNDELPDWLLPYERLCRECMTVYHRLQEAFSEDTYRYALPNTPPIGFFQSINAKLHAALEDCSPSQARPPSSAA